MRRLWILGRGCFEGVRGSSFQGRCVTLGYSSMVLILLSDRGGGHWSKYPCLMHSPVEVCYDADGSDVIYKQSQKIFQTATNITQP